MVSAPPAAASEQVVAVFPFSVRGSEELQYLGEGMVNLLSTKLDGAGDLRAVDPRALLSQVQREGDTILDPQGGAGVARHFGAGLFVMGDVVEAGGQLQLQASLYDAAQDAQVLGSASVQGQAERLFELVDEMAAQLLANVSGGLSTRVQRIAVTTTSSLPALKAYLEGESSLRAGDFDAALAAFETAIVHDPEFALAHYRLSIAADWAFDSTRSIEAAEEALRLAGRLAQRDRQLLEAWLALRAGRPYEAARLYRSIVGTYRDDFEAWFQLGEVLFHYNPIIGRPFVEAREPFEKVLAIEPDLGGAIVHLARIAAHEGRSEDLDALVERMLAQTPSADRALPILALKAFTTGTPEEREAVLGRLEGASDPELGLAIWEVGSYSKNIRGALSIADILATRPGSPGVQAVGRNLRVYLLVAQGKWAAARDELAAIRRLDPPVALESAAYLSLVPFLPKDRTQQERLKAGLEDFDPDVPASGNPTKWFNVHDGLHHILKTYLYGMLSAQLGDEAAAERSAAQLAAIEAPRNAGTMATDFALSIRAEMLRRAGAVEEALAELERIRLENWNAMMIASPFLSETYERFMRAELLLEVGRLEEALSWYENLFGSSVYEVAFRPIADLRRGQILERLGRAEEAAERYRHFIEAWRDCDPELRPAVVEAEGRLAALTSE